MIEISQVFVFGNDYATEDGTALRDYIHVMDLADAHVSALIHIRDDSTWAGFVPINVGTGRGTSVLEMIRTFEQITGVHIPFEVVGRREGDVERVWASTDYAEKVLGWKAKYELCDMIRDQWKWATHNPNGYLDDTSRATAPNPKTLG